MGLRVKHSGWCGWPPSPFATILLPHPLCCVRTSKVATRSKRLGIPPIPECLDRCHRLNLLSHILRYFSGWMKSVLVLNDQNVFKMVRTFSQMFRLGGDFNCSLIKIIVQDYATSFLLQRSVSKIVFRFADTYLFLYFNCLFNFVSSVL